MVASCNNEESRTTFGVGDDGDAQFTLSTVHEHAVCYGICSDKSNSMLSGNPHSGIYEADTSRTLDNNCGNPACNQGGIAVVEPKTFCKTAKPCNADEAQTIVESDIAPTLGTHDISEARQNQYVVFPDTDVMQTLTARNSGGGQRMPDKGNLSVICVKDEQK